MERTRPGYGDLIAGCAAILLSYFMCLDWFGSTDSGELRLFSVGRSAWEGLDYIPIVLVIAIVAALAVPTLRLMKPDSRLPLLFHAVVGFLGISSASLILIRIVEPPNFGSFTELWGTIPIEGTVQTPIFFALGAAVGIVVGAWLAMWEENSE